MTQLTATDFKNRYSGVVSRDDKNRILNSFSEVHGLPADLKPAKDTIWLAGGQPFESMFPIQGLDLFVRDKPGSLDEDSVVSQDSTITKLQMYETSSKSNIESNNSGNKLGLNNAFQYAHPKGFPELRSLTKQIITRINKPIYDGWDTLITNGSSDSLSKICKLLIDSESTMLIEEFTFTNILNHLQFAGGHAVPIKLDITTDSLKQGIDTEYLDDLLENWEKYHPGKPKAKCLYTITTGQNPTGLTQSMEKRQKIYDICCKHNIIIIEDDPYGYLKLPKYNSKSPMTNPYFNNEYTVDQYCTDILSPSYMTIDTQGIVLRCETFSKVASPGLRLGFIAGNQFFIDRLTTITAITTRAASGASQAIVTNMLVDMGERYQSIPGNENAPLIDGWIEWCMKIAGQYTHRRNYMFKALFEQPIVKEGMVELIEPSCGMFVSVVINLKPEWLDHDIKRAMDYLYCCLLEEGCLAVLGYKMTIDRSFSMDRANFLRFTFAKASNPKIFELGAERFNTAVQRLFKEYGVKETFSLSEKGFD